MTMMHYIVVREDSPGRFTAYPCGLPELSVTALTKGAAVLSARDEFVRWVKEGKLMPVNVTVAVEELLPPPPLSEMEEELHREFIRDLAEHRRQEDEEFGIWKVEPGDEEGRRWVEETIRYRKEHLKGTIWDYEIPWPDTSSTPPTSPITPTATPSSAPESTASPPATSS
jgi:hypothetical protein